MLSFFKGPGNPVQVVDCGAEVCAANSRRSSSSSLLNVIYY